MEVYAKLLAFEAVEWINTLADIKYLENTMDSIG